MIEITGERRWKHADEMGWLPQKLFLGIAAPRRQSEAESPCFSLLILIDRQSRGLESSADIRIVMG